MTASNGPSEPQMVARWDLDKTYLRTEFDTVRDLVRTAIERPDRKRSVPGAAALLRELSACGARIHILSGSPRQMRSRLEEKLAIDRVRWDELTLKPNLSNLARLRFRAMRDQLGYKLPSLLEARVRDQYRASESETRELLVGDDAEADAFVYSLYADLCSGKLPRTRLLGILERGQLYTDQRDACLAAFDRLARAPVVERILIHLDRQTSPSAFRDYGPRVVPFYNYFQAALVLAEDELVPPAAALRVADELITQHRFDADALSRSYLDLARRGHARGVLVPPLRAALEDLQAQGRLAAQADELNRALVSMAEVADAVPRDPPEAGDLDYEALAERHRGGRNRRRKG